MNQLVKRFLVTGASLFMLAGVSAGFNCAAHSAHASMPTPEFYHSTRYRNNVYYGISRSKYGENVNYYLYGKMPTAMRKRGRLFGLYYGHRYNKEIGGYHDSLNRVIHRHGRTYLPDYVGAVTPHNRINYRGHRGWIEDIMLNRHDVNLRRPISERYENRAVQHDNLRSVKYSPVARRSRIVRRHYRKPRVRHHVRRSRAARRHYRKPRIRRHRARRRYRRTVRRHRVRKSVKRHYRKARRVKRQLVQPQNQPQINTPSVNQPVQPSKTTDNNVSQPAPKQPYQHVDMNEVANREVADVNQDRQANGASPLTVSNPLSAIASERAKQLESNFSHYDSNGNMYAEEDADNLGDTHQQNGIEDWSNAENINEAQPYGTADQIADRMNYGFMYNDASSDWGHRKNILNPNYNYIGIGTYYDPNASDGVPYKLAEDFSSNQYY